MENDTFDGTLVCDSNIDTKVQILNTSDFDSSKTSLKPVYRSEISFNHFDFSTTGSAVNEISAQNQNVTYKVV